MYKATAYYVMASDQIFSPFMSSSPVASLLLSVGTRTIFGLLVGLAFLLVKRLFSNKRLGIAIVSILSPTVHAAIVYAVMGLFFPQQNLGSSSNFILDLSNILATLLCFLLLQFLWSLYKLPLVRNFCSYVNHPTKNLRGKNPLYIAWGIFILFTLSAAIASSYYFANRMSYMLTAHGVTLTSEINHDLLHLQYQFMIDHPIRKQELIRKFDIFGKEISGLLSDSHKVSCSIGAYYFDTPQDFQTIYANADKMPKLGYGVYQTPPMIRKP